jgi:hypothetical protein
MKKPTETLPQALGIENDDQIIEQCLAWMVTEDDIGEILKKIMCSDYDSKEILFASYVIGRMQNASKEQVHAMMMETVLRNIRHLIKDKE